MKDDPSAPVRMRAARALAEFGTEADAQAAFTVLLDAADWSEERRLHRDGRAGCARRHRRQTRAVQRRRRHDRPHQKPFPPKAPPPTPATRNTSRASWRNCASASLIRSRRRKEAGHSKNRRPEAGRRVSGRVGVPPAVLRVPRSTRRTSAGDPSLLVRLLCVRWFRRDARTGRRDAHATRCMPLALPCVSSFQTLEGKSARLLPSAATGARKKPRLSLAQTADSLYLPRRIMRFPLALTPVSPVTSSAINFAALRNLPPSSSSNRSIPATSPAPAADASASIRPRSRT